MNLNNKGGDKERGQWQIKINKSTPQFQDKWIETPMQNNVGTII